MTTSAEPTSVRNPGLSPGAQLYLCAVYAAAISGYVVASSPSDPSPEGWLLAALLATGAALAQLTVVITPRNQAYHASPVFVLAAAILLPPELVAFVVVVQHVPEWLRERYPWYIQTFNIANYGLAALCASAVFDGWAASTSHSEIAFVLGGLAAGEHYVTHGAILLLNQLDLITE